DKRIPDSKAKVVNLWFLLEGEEMVNQMVNSDKSAAVVQAMVSGIETKQSKQMLKDIENYLASNNTDDCTMFLTGSPIIYDHLDKSLSRSQIQSLIIALVLVFICLIVMMRSFWISVVGLIPIIFTLIVIFGFMGYAKIPLDVATVLVGSVSIGIGIDYAIHFLNRYQQEIKQNKHHKIKAVLNTLKTSGRAILINVLTVSIGFLVLVFANLIPLQRFGILIAITMIFSGISALVILPAIILVTNRNREEK
ncbi:MAG: MMPL family transporter, partial [candidate division WOR-3 bacterium]